MMQSYRDLPEREVSQLQGMEIIDFAFGRVFFIDGGGIVMRQKWKILIVILLFSFILIENSTTVEAAGITTYKAMNVGENETLEIDTEETITYSTYNEKVATVSEDGTITAVEQGATVIKAETESQNYYCRVTVTKPSLKLSKKSAVIYYGGNAGNSIQLRAIVAGADSLVTWESSEPSVADVDCVGKVTARGEGTTVITATANGVTQECAITVKETKIDLPVESVQLGTKGKGNSYKIFPVITGQSQKVTWSSSDKSVATVSSGQVTGKKTGTVVITATANGVSTSCKVTVFADSVAIDKEQVVLYTEGSSVHTANLTATVAGKKQTVLWNSSNEAVATVDGKGNVTAIREGEAVITASYKGTTDTCKVIVKATEITLDNTELSLNTKGTDSSAVLKAVVTGSKSSVKWTSSDSSVASVSGGKVSGKKTGTATITATANGVSVSCVVHVTSTSISMTKTAILDADAIGTLTLNPVVSGLSKEIEWKSSDNAIATVENGVVTPVRQGTVNITATANGISANCRVTVKKADISLNQQKITLYTGTSRGNTATLKSIVTGTNKTVQWTSSDRDVVVVDSKGKLTAMGEGNATITATANGKSAQCDVTVFATSVTLSKQEVELTKDYYHNTESLTAEVTGISKSISWKSSDTKVATISQGVITAKGTGTATITATANSASASCVVTVVETKDEAPAIVLNESHVLLTKNSKTNKYFNLAATVTGPSNAVTWDSSDKNIVTVDKKGKLTAKNTGNATITAIANGKEARCEVEVTENRIVLDKTALSLNTDGDDTTAVLHATIEGSCTDSVVWKSSNIKVATIDQNGKIAAVSKGTVTFTASVNGVSASCKATVITNSISLNKKTATLYVGGNGVNTISLKPTVKGSSKEIHWTSSDETVAGVDEKGNVTAFQPGACIITAEANGIMARCDVSVLGNSLELSHTEITLHTKGSFTTDTIVPSVSGATSKITWKSEDTSVATVKDGVVTAKRAGDTIITATANGISRECQVHVVEPSITLQESATIYLVEKEGQPASIDLSPVIVGKETEVMWYSKDTSVVTVEGGIITSVSAGTTTVNAYANGVTASCMVTVEDNHAHIFEWVVEKEADCETEGIRNYICSICGKVEASEPIEALGHDWGEWITVKEPTETEKGEKKHICSRCNKEETEDIPEVAHEHQYSSIVTEPTCTEQGYTTHTCRCGDSYIDTYVDALGHEWGEWVTTKEPTQTKEGEKRRTCTRCETEEKEIISVITHNYVDTVTEPTCTEQGYTTHTCSECGDTYVDTYVDALGHDYEWVIKKEPTCTEDGLKEYKCIRCGDISETETIDAAHAWGDWTVTKEPASGAHTKVSDFGEQKRTCSMCGQIEEESIINIDLGNGEAKTLYGSFRDDEAYKTLDMVNDLRTSLGLNELKWFDGFEDLGKIRSAEIYYSFSHTRPSGKPRSIIINDFEITTGENIHLGSVYASSAFNAWKESSGHYANMTKESYKSYYCACFKVREYNDFYMKYTYGNCWVQLFTSYDLSGVEDTCEHVYTDTVTAPTCSEQGYTTHTCGKCGDSYIDTYTDALGHEYADMVTAPTCSEQGYTTHACTRCGDIYKDTYTEALEEYDEGEWITTKESDVSLQD